MQDTHAKAAILILLTPYAGGRVHQRRKRAIRTAESPHPDKLCGVDGRTLAHQSDRGRDVTGFLDSGLNASTKRIGFRIVVAPQTSVFHIDGFGQVGGQCQEAVIGDVVQPFDNF